MPWLLNRLLPDKLFSSCKNSSYVNKSLVCWLLEVCIKCNIWFLLSSSILTISSHQCQNTTNVSGMNTTFITNTGKKYANIKKCIPITDREYILRLFNHFVTISVYELGLPMPNCSRYALLCQYVSSTISVTRAINTKVSITDRYRFIPAVIFSHLIICFITLYYSTEIVLCQPISYLDLLRLNSLL